ncbi:cupin domain-containing protein [Carbonactinospora thermoautotrophica]|uniref:cupin domain-containing protein n=1 Tax=Carbonactinospora thermoautotrophica TaxID=1469144 RepID=UPI002270752B|nr:cupin domain-containing protein [Carbonactinospora thermoautotrophica]MCX9192915.1 cupin domain-containing protein [Carbonactinospora thermoautotrophica]
MTVPRPVVVAPGDGFHLPRPKVMERMLLPGASAGGSLSMMEITVQPGGLVAPVHVHAHEDETVFVIEGRVGVRLGDLDVEAEPGSVVFGPRGVAHSFWNAGNSTARMIMAITPGNLDRYFRGISEVAAPNDPSALEKLVAHAASFGMEIDLDSLAELAEKYHVTLF